MRSHSRTAVVIAVILAFSIMNFPGPLVAQGAPSSLYPVTISLGDDERVFFANHKSGLADGNWIELGGGTAVKLPSLKCIYEGPEVVSYTRDGATVTLDSRFIPGQMTYPLPTHQVYKPGQLVSAKFWGSTDLGGKQASFMLLRASSLSEIRDVLNEGFLGIINTLLDSLVWIEYGVQLNSAGDGTHSFNAPAAGDYILVVAKIDLSSLKFYVYSATAIEVVDYTLDISAASSVVKGEALNVEATLRDAPSDSYIYGFAMIKESSYSGKIKLSTEGTVLSTQLYLNDKLMADGDLFADFFTGEKDQSDLNIDLIEELLNKAFNPNELSFTDSTTGSTALSTSSLTPGKYVLLAGVWRDWDSKIVGLKQTTVTVTSPYEPPPTPPLVNKNPKADAGSNVKISVGSSIHFSGADSYDPDGTIVAYSWDFGDGTTATGVEVDHTYSEPGHYTVTLVVRDDRGAEASDKCEVNVWQPSNPVVNRFSESIPGGVKGHIVDAMDETNITVTLNTTKPVTVTILRYEGNPHPEDPMPEYALPIYFDVEVSNSTAVEWPIYVEVHYTDEMVEGLDESLLGIYYWKTGAWHRCSHTGVDTERNVIWAYMTEEEVSGSPILFGYTLIKTAEFVVSDLSITPSEVEPGELVTISVLVTNVGEETGTYTVTLDVDIQPYFTLGELISMEVTLEGGGSEEMEFKVTRETEGTYKVEVDGLSGSFEVKAPIVTPKPAKFEVSNLVVSPSEVTEGEEVTITVDVKNIGEEKGTYTVFFKVDGVTVDTVETPLDGGESKTIAFTLVGEAGTHTVEIEDMMATFTVNAKTVPFWLSPGYISGICILVLATVATLYLLYRRGRLPLQNLPKEEA